MRNFFSIIGLLAVLALSCGKDIDVFIPDDPVPVEPTPLTGQISDFFDAVQPEAFSANLDISLGGTFQTPGNNYFTLEPNSLIDADGQVIQGLVTIEITEVLSKGDMIVHDTPTESNNMLIESAGAFHIKIRQGDKELALAPNQEGLTVQIPITGNYNPNMELFYGKRENDGSFNWEEADDDPDNQFSVWITETYDSLAQSWGISYEFLTQRLDWINCDAFTAETELTAISLDLPESYTDTNSVAYMVFEDFNSILPIPWNTEKNQFYRDYIPLNTAVNLIVISAKTEDQFHFSQLNTTTTADKTIELNPTEKTLGDILEFLSAL